ncbi:hypothetical protein [Pseudomonas cannabina]|uniref:hypothetical protein n=1 Tax=Pseudomonas cannabina TaxID=86840 RepID=UPI00287BB0F6|nr:hypothetical protein [Pseudomonas cannabina]
MTAAGQARFAKIIFYCLPIRRGRYGSGVSGRGRGGRRLARRFGFLKQLSGFLKYPFTDTSQRVRGALGRLFGPLLQVGGVANVRCCWLLDYVSGVPVGRRYLHGESPCPLLPSDGEVNPEKSFINWVSRDDWRFHRNALG